MTKANLAIAAAFLAIAAFFASAAEACISCSYTPEVVHTPTKPPQAKRPQKSRDATVARPARKRVVKSPPPAEEAVPAKEAEAPKDVETAKDIETTKETTPAEAQADTAASGSATAALNEHEAGQVEEPKAGGDVGCKKFSATVGTTVTVPCE